MPEARERKESDKIKDGSRGKKSTPKNDVRRQMTAKFQKQMIEHLRKQDGGSSTETTPEAQAAEQVEEKIYTTADSIRERTGDAVSKSIARHKRKRQEKKQRTESTASKPPSADTKPAPSPAQERIQQKAPDDVRTRSAEARHDPPVSLREQQIDGIHEKPRKSRPSRERVTTEVSRHDAKRTTAEVSRSDTKRTTETAPRLSTERKAATEPRSGSDRISKTLQPKERMRQDVIKGKRDRHIQIQQRTSVPQGQQTSVPASGRAMPSGESKQTYSKPQERMRQRAAANTQAQHRNGTPGRPRGLSKADPPLERPPASKSAIGKKSISSNGQSINPIKERPRRSFALKEKPANGAFVPKTRPNVKGIRSPLKNASMAKKGKVAARPLERMRKRIQRNAQRKLLQKSTRTTKAAVEMSKKVIAAITRAASSAISSLVGLIGGAVLVPVICLIIFAAAILASPFGILFSNEPTTNAVPLNVAVGNLNMELSNQLQLLQSGGYDSFDVQGQGPDWREVVAVFAVKNAGADNGVDVAALTPDRVERLRAVFWDMCIVTSEVETIDHPDSDPDDDTDDSWTERILHITITAKQADDMRTEYAFTEYQNEALTELLAELAAMDILLTDLAAIEEKARELIQRLPADLSPERRAVVETACRLVGKVNYFWGGKSLVIGWDSRWGSLQQVWAAGSPSTGTYRPYGMDCSGFVDWVFYNMSGGSYIIGHGGGAHAQHTYCTAITWAEAQPGDLVFYPEDTHVGIVGGWDENGNILIIHCASGQNNVVITGKSGFTTIGRPIYYEE